MRNRILPLIAAMVLTLSTYAASFETDRTWYLAGEAMKVSITADDALIAYAELCDMKGLAAGIAVSLKGGEGTGIIELPSDLHSGYYVLSVYTRHNANVSNRLIAVVNPLCKSADDDIEWVKISHPDSLSHPESTWSNVQCLRGNNQWSTFNVRETEGHIIKVRIKNDYEGKPFRAKQITPALSIIGKQIHYFEGKMVNDSIAVFYTYGIHGRQPLVLSAMSSTGVSLPVEMISPFATLLPKQLPHLVFHYQRSEVEARSIEMQRHQMDLGSVSAIPLNYDETVFGTKPDLSYNLDEYRQFLTIREVLLEYVSFVRTIKKRGLPQLIVRRDQEHYNTTIPSLVLIDGMPVFDTELLLNYDARRLHYINIYGGQYTFGKDVYNGLLSFVTRSGQLTNYPVEHNMQYLEYDFP